MYEADDDEVDLGQRMVDYQGDCGLELVDEINSAREWLQKFTAVHGREVLEALVVGLLQQEH
jgi:hypothetical protein